MVSLTHLRCILIRHCPCIMSTEEDILPASRQSFYVIFCRGGKFLTPIEEMHQYTSLEVRQIVHIGGPLVSFPVLNHRVLSIHECNNLENVSIPRGTDLGDLMSLQELQSVCVTN